MLLEGRLEASPLLPVQIHYLMMLMKHFRVSECFVFLFKIYFNNEMCKDFRHYFVYVFTA